MAEKAKAPTVTLLCCVSSDGAATWPQTVARDDAAVETCEPDSLMKKLDEFKEQPVAVLADQNSYDAAATACRDASKTGILRGTPNLPHRRHQLGTHPPFDSFRP